MISYSLSIARADLGAAADYWFAVADGRPPDEGWMAKLPMGARTATIDARSAELADRKAAVSFSVSIDPDAPDAVLFRASAD